MEGNSATGRGAVSSDNHDPAKRTATKANAAVDRRAAESNIAGPERVGKCKRSNFIAGKYNPLEGGLSMDFTRPGMGIFHAGFEADIGPADDHESPGKLGTGTYSSNRASAKNQTENIPSYCGPVMAQPKLEARSGCGLSWLTTMAWTCRVESLLAREVLNQRIDITRVECLAGLAHCAHATLRLVSVIFLQSCL